jgi:hypothetical protein
LADQGNVFPEIYVLEEDELVEIRTSYAPPFAAWNKDAFWSVDAQGNDIFRIDLITGDVFMSGALLVGDPLPASAITEQLIASQLGDGAVVTRVLAAASVIAGKIAANAISGKELLLPAGDELGNFEQESSVEWWNSLVNPVVLRGLIRVIWVAGQQKDMLLALFGGLNPQGAVHQNSITIADGTISMRVDNDNVVTLLSRGPNVGGFNNPPTSSFAKVGEVTPALPIGAIVTRGTDQPIAGATPVSITFDTLRRNVGVSVALPSINLAVSPGVYDIKGAVRWTSNATGWRRLGIYINGVEEITDTKSLPFAISADHNISTEVVITSASNISLRASQGSGVSLNCIAGWTRLSVMRRSL